MHTIYWATVTSNGFALYYRTVVCPVVCNVGVLWPNGWMDQDITSYTGRPWSRPHCVRWGPSSPTERGTAIPHFSAHCSGTVAHLSNCLARLF